LCKSVVSLMLVALLLLALSMATLHAGHDQHADHSDSGTTCIVCALVKGHCGVPVNTIQVNMVLPILVTRFSQPVLLIVSDPLWQLPATRAPPVSE
jgi:hypothetical protein